MELQHNSNHHSCKRSRAKFGRKDDDYNNSERKITAAASVVGAKNNDRIMIPWQQQFPANRIYRVSRASGGKDRHSKVYTAKGLRDRRVRLSVSTAIQFYDLQDRLGYDQPSKAIEWLLKAADSAINDLPELDFLPKAPYPGAEEQQVLPETEIDTNINNFSQNRTKSGCSSTSETSKGSVLSLSRSDSRVKAKEKDCEESNANHGNNFSVALTSPASFTELLTGNGAAASTIPGDNCSPNSNGIHKQMFSFSQQQQARKADHHQLLSGFSSQAQQQSIYGSSSAAAALAMMPFNLGAPEMQQHQFSFMSNHLSDYNLNFSMSSAGLSGFDRGTLQSNSQPQLAEHQSHDGTNNLPFYFGAAANAPSENHFLTSLDGRLQLCYGEGFRHSDMKGKGKS